MNDSQASNQVIFRPQSNFESIYSGEDAGSNPLYLFPSVAGQTNVQNVDNLAQQGVDGYDPNLARGARVPMFSRCLLWLPAPFYTFEGNATPYEYILIWRLRNLFDFANDRRPYHIPSRGGEVDTFLNQTRVAVPACIEAISFKQTEPGAGAIPSAAQVTSYFGNISPMVPVIRGPLISSGSWQPTQQGVFDRNVAGVNRADSPSFATYETTCKGDELLVAVRRSTGGNWDFAGIDGDLTEFLNPIYRFNGVYLFFGSGVPFSTADVV